MLQGLPAEPPLPARHAHPAHGEAAGKLPVQESLVAIRKRVFDLYGEAGTNADGLPRQDELLRC